ncbi:LuxR C-terminal-related transcriptional regulator [Pantoea sp. S-LA4]|uniref:LuxR C-terminal-related transcriptional regulator n=1 Tax=Pantoea TaxID=53335 RepID=UPI001F361210|nr:MULTISPECIES: LuxR C-terminal-related transcriptional regulator [Pantoea]UIL54648.1 LuxR C-terminal-related transcriptional regulator [Pantoea agglomerans]
MRNASVRHHINNLVIPDFWDGNIRNNIRYLSDEKTGSEYYLKPRMNISSVEIDKVMMIAGNDYAVMGVRHVLANNHSVHLKVTSKEAEIQPVVDEFRPKVVIWMFNSANEFYESITDILNVRRNHNKIKQIIISEELPATFCGEDVIVEGVSLIPSTVSVQQLAEMISSCLVQKQFKHFFVRKWMSKRQFRVMAELGKGKKTSDVSRVLNIDCKTVLAHKYKAVNKLGISNRKEEAWAMRAITQLYTAIPCLEKLCRRTAGC